MSLEATVTPHGLVLSLTCPFGVHSLLGFFLKCYEHDSLLWAGGTRSGDTFIDDDIGHEKDFDPPLVLLEVFKRLIFWNLRLNSLKCYFGGYEAEFLGHLVDGARHKHLSRRVTVISDMVRPLARNW